VLGLPGWSEAAFKLLFHRTPSRARGPPPSVADVIVSGSGFLFSKEGGLACRRKVLAAPVLSAGAAFSYSLQGECTHQQFFAAVSPDLFPFARGGWPAPRRTCRRCSSCPPTYFLSTPVIMVNTVPRCLRIQRTNVQLPTCSSILFLFVFISRFLDAGHEVIYLLQKRKLCPFTRS